ncbi:hypothetical protein Tsubulata_014518 [Turnera subulata]|uniref:Cytosine-specific methyltransferase n=1 Tax=Turnera subulata TaxID=218843 RepID=A0A9Q0FDA3_9ROSI|nr:hypothetical protein Tsubulata_014518 [Turnera subulata]
MPSKRNPRAPPKPPSSAVAEEEKAQATKQRLRSTAASPPLRSCKRLKKTAAEQEVVPVEPDEKATSTTVPPVALSSSSSAKAGEEANEVASPKTNRKGKASPAAKVETEPASRSSKRRRKAAQAQEEVPVELDEEMDGGDEAGAGAGNRVAISLLPSSSSSANLEVEAKGQANVENAVTSPSKTKLRGRALAASPPSNGKKEPASQSRKSTRTGKHKEKEASVDLEEEEVNDVDEAGARLTSAPEAGGSGERAAREKQRRAPKQKVAEGDDEPRFLGNPIPLQEAKNRWPHRYEKNCKKPEGYDNDVEIKQARRHYSQALIDGHILHNLGDCAYVQVSSLYLKCVSLTWNFMYMIMWRNLLRYRGEVGGDNYICKILEFFEAIDGDNYFTAQWFYRARDTEIQSAFTMDNKRVFMSYVKDDNPLDCLLGKVNIAQVGLRTKPESILPCDYYCNMLYQHSYSTFSRLPTENETVSIDESFTATSSDDENGLKTSTHEESQNKEEQRQKATLLDMYAGCGAMSTGLCLGAKLAGLDLVTRWAVDINSFACESLKLNHPETEVLDCVRNEAAEDFLLLLKEWEKLCIRFSLVTNFAPDKVQQYPFDIVDEEEEDDDDDDEEEEEVVDNSEVFEVEKILQICYGDPNNTRHKGLYFKIRWKNYSEEYDTWEPLDGLGNCCNAMREFVTNGYRDNILPLPGHVDVICGGPPCQGISGFNRFRNAQNPLQDEKNKQMIIFMDMVKHLMPKYVLMENVVDLLKFSKGFLGRYALGRLVDMDYQARIGLMVAGAYGLPQFRMRVFLWGACPTKNLPPYPLPTHDVIVRGVVPQDFEHNVVGHEKNTLVNLKDKLILEDALSDLPMVNNDEPRDEMPYTTKPQTEFQKRIRSKEYSLKSSSTLLYDHRPLRLNEDDYQRVCQIPKKKGANFRDLTGVRVGDNNKVEFDPAIPRVLLPSGKPLVPDYAMSFIEGKSSKPFGRLWWDEIVPTVVTRAEPHNQVILHPEQDRVLSVRENARLQGFPDCYKLCGPIKERYTQVGNAVAVPVAMALGYSLGLAFQGKTSDEPLYLLPKRYPDL